MKVLTGNGEKEVDVSTTAETIEDVLEEHLGEEVFIDHNKVERFVAGFINEHNRKETEMRFAMRIEL